MGFTDAAGNAITTSYNGLGQLASVTRTDGTITYTWTVAKEFCVFRKNFI